MTCTGVDIAISSFHTAEQSLCVGLIVYLAAVRWTRSMLNGDFMHCLRVSRFRRARFRLVNVEFFMSSFRQSPFSVACHISFSNYLGILLCVALLHCNTEHNKFHVIPFCYFL